MNFMNIPLNQPRPASPNIGQPFSHSTSEGERAGVRGSKSPNRNLNRNRNLNLARNLPRLIPLLLALLLPGLAQAKLNVVATTPDIAAIAKEIGGSAVDITTLAKPTEDPHFVDAKPSFIVKLNHADAIIEGGAELEIGWLPALLDQARNSKLAPGAPAHISCAEGVQMLEVPTALDRSRGDIHAAGNPHFLVDPVNAKKAAEHIRDAFCNLDQKSSETYRANFQKFSDALDAKLKEWQAPPPPLKAHQIAPNHIPWPYSGEVSVLKIDLFLDPNPGVLPPR